MFSQVPTDWPATWEKSKATTDCRNALEDSEISKACAKITIERDQARLDCIADVKVCGGSRM